MRRAALLLVVLFATPLAAQRRGSSVLTGTVLTDVGGLPVVGAEVTIPAEQLSVVTDSSGAYRLTRIPTGAHDVIVRRLGYTLMTHTMTFGPSDTLRRAFYLNRPQTLDTITVSEQSTIPSFNENRRLGLGSFRTRAELEKLEQVRMSSVVREMRGVHVAIAPIGGSGAWVTGGRGATGESRAPSSLDSSRGAKPDCYSNVYLDRMLIYSGKPGEPLFDVNSLMPHQVEALEFYSRTAVPMEYSRGSTACGVLVVHTRRFEPRKDK